MYNQQGITENYPQYTTNFWGDAGNNYSKMFNKLQNIVVKKYRCANLSKTEKEDETA